MDPFLTRELLPKYATSSEVGDMRQTFLSGTEQQNHHQPNPTTQDPYGYGLIIGPLCLHGLFFIWETTVTLGLFTLQ